MLTLMLLGELDDYVDPCTSSATSWNSKCIWWRAAVVKGGGRGRRQVVPHRFNFHSSRTCFQHSRSCGAEVLGELCSALNVTHPVGLNFLRLQHYSLHEWKEGSIGMVIPRGL